MLKTPVAVGDIQLLKSMTDLLLSVKLTISDMKDDSYCFLITSATGKKAHQYQSNNQTRTAASCERRSNTGVVDDRTTQLSRNMRSV